MDRCLSCNKKLRNETSRRLGMGPVCRRRESSPQRREADLFMGADFEYQIVQGVVCITDLDQGGMSVTNDIENVLASIGREVDLEEKNVIYRDSRGVWSGINHVGSEFTGFRPIRVYPEFVRMLEEVKKGKSI
jgi:hypothetical protein